MWPTFDRLGQRVGVQRNRSAQERTEQQNVDLRDEFRTDHDFGNIIGDSRRDEATEDRRRTGAADRLTVLILGETGTGQELIARAIHEGKVLRRDNLLVKVNCASLRPDFDRENCSATGRPARSRGERAATGTIRAITSRQYFWTISEVPAETQVMLPRVLQERVIERVGSGSEPIDVDTCVIAASNRNLKTASEEAQAKEDLYYRLNVFPILVPPRARREDIPSCS